MRATKLLSTLTVMVVVGALASGALTASASAAVAAAQPTNPAPVCAGPESGPKRVVVDVTQDVRNQPLLPARDGHMWARFAYRQHLRIWPVGRNTYCVRKDYVGSWRSVAGRSPGLTGTISNGLTGTFRGTEYWLWKGKLAPIAATSGYLGKVNADCTAVDVCADDSYLIVNNYYFSQGWKHCRTVRASMEVEGGEHGQLSLRIKRGQHRVTGTGDITG